LKNTGIMLGLDPSSTRTGYALLKSPTEIIEAGCLRPLRSRDAALSRICHIRSSLVELIHEHLPNRVCIEVPSGKVGGGQRRGASASAMAVYGMAAGMMLATCLEHCGDHTFPVNEREWTGRVPKNRRNRLIAAQFPAYREQLNKDRGGDVGDAIGLALWAYGRLRNEGDET